MNLTALLEPRSIAVVGASARPGSFGDQLVGQLLAGGYKGEVHLVNPRYAEVAGRPCRPSLADLPGPVDPAVLAVPNAALEAQLGTAAAVGIPAAVIFASCLEPDGLLERLRAVAAAYLDHALDLPSTRVAALFLETVREPAAFAAALAKAAAPAIPVVVLKVGRGQAARAMVAAHSGALAGEEGAYQALFDAYGVAQVATLDELADTCQLLAGRRAAPGGLAAIHDSGGERAHLLDVAERAGVGFAAISAATRARLAAVLEPGLPATNPLDAWGTGNDADQIFAACIAALLEDPATGALALNLDLTTEPAPETSYTGLAVTAAASTTKPVAVLANLASAVDPAEAATLRAAGVPVLEGTATGLAAFAHLFAYRDFLARAAVGAGPGGTGAVDSRAHPGSGSATLPHQGTRRGSAAVEAARGPGGLAARDRWVARLGDGRPLDEVEGLALLADWGIPVVAAEVATGLEGALAAAERVGWPVALKTAAPGVAHKSDVGGVRLGLDGPEQLAAAYAELAGRLGPRVAVAAMAEPGVELALGVVADPQFGPLVMVAAGGVLVEVLRDRRFALPPVDHQRALAMLDRLAVRPLLDGVRGGSPVDLGAVADAVCRLSVLALDLGDSLAALDVNPLVGGPAGCLAVDALVVATSAAPPAGR